MKWFILITCLLLVVAIAVVVLRGKRAKAPTGNTIVDAAKSVAAAVSPCPDEVDTAVMRKLMHGTNLHAYNDLQVWLSKDYSEQHWNPLFDAEQREIDRIREWAKTLPDRCVRSAYNSWLDNYYSSGLRDAINELRNRTTQKEMDKYHADNARQNERVRQLESVSPVPAPPK